MTGFPRGRHNGPTMKKHKLGTIRIVSEKQIPYVELRLDMDDDTVHRLAQAGWMEIQHDREALVEYAFCKALKEFAGARGTR